jgi:hypothetical protein
VIHVVKSRTGIASGDKAACEPTGRPAPSHKLIPTAIPGTHRERLELTPADLIGLSPLASPEVARRATRMLQEFVLESATDRSAILWGHRLQEGYGELVSRTLDLSQNPTLEKAAGYVRRMTTILASIDLQAISQGSAGSGGIGQYLKRLNQRVDTPEELEKARLELDQLVRLMAGTMEPLLTLKEGLERASQSVDEIGTEIEAAALAAQYLASRFAGGREDLSRRFMDRAMSLTQSVAQIRGSSTLRAAQVDQPLSLIAAVQTIALVTVPGWISSLSAMTAVLQGKRRPTPTETGELEFQLRQILQQLKA